MTSFVGIFSAWYALAMLLVIRIVVREDRAAWALLVVMLVGVVSWSILLIQPYAMSVSTAPLIIAGLFAIFTAVVLRRHGLLGCSVLAIVAAALLNTPLTADLSRWSAWRTLAVVALVIAFAVWGFRNVLGPQSAFAAADLDA